MVMKEIKEIRIINRINGSQSIPVWMRKINRKWKFRDSLIIRYNLMRLNYKMIIIIKLRNKRKQKYKSAK